LRLVEHRQESGWLQSCQNGLTAFLIRCSFMVNSSLRSSAER
jgi:hypothetical protein